MDEEPKKVRPLNWGKKPTLKKYERPPVKSFGWEKEGDDAVKGEEKTGRAFLRVLLILGLMGLLGVWWWLVSTPASNQTSAPVKNLVPDQPKETLYDLPPLTVAENFALTGDPGERLKWARRPEETARKLAAYPAHAREVPAIKVSKLHMVGTGDLIYETFAAEFEEGPPRFLCVIGTPEGPRVDWDAYARYGTAGWGDLISGKTLEAKVRVFPSPDTYFNRGYQDANTWVCYRLDSPDLDLPVYGYCRKNSEVGLEMRDLAASGARRATLTLKAQKSASGTRQFEITAVNAIGWVED